MEQDNINVWKLNNALDAMFNPTVTWVVSKYLVRCIGATEVILLMELGELSTLFKSNTFTVTRRHIQQSTSFSVETQENAEERLIELGLIDRKFCNNPIEIKYIMHHDVIDGLINGEGNYECQKPIKSFI